MLIGWIYVDVNVVCCTGKTVTGVGQGLDATVSGVGKTAGKYVPGRRVGGTVEGVTKGVGGTVSVLFLMIERYNNTYSPICIPKAIEIKC